MIHNVLIHTYFVNMTAILFVFIFHDNTSVLISPFVFRGRGSLGSGWEGTIVQS